MPKGFYKRPTEEERFASKFEKLDDENACWHWTALKDKDGYGWFSLKNVKGTKLKHIAAHRYSLMQKLNDFSLPSNIIARHTCDTPSCVNPNHLIPGSVADNAADMVERNRQLSGEKNNAAKITEEIALEILATHREDKAAGRMYQSNIRMAAKYGINKQIIVNVISGATWKHLSRD
jgi:hypothetical protein